MQRRFGQRALGDHERRFARECARESRTNLRRQGLQLQNRGRPIHIGADQQHFFALFLDQPTRELARRRRLARTLQAGEHHDHRALRTQIQAGTRLAHELGQLLMDDLDEGLAGRQALDDFGADRASLDRLRKTLDDGQSHVSIEQGKPNLPHGIGNIIVRESPAARERTQRLAESCRQLIKHGAYYRGLRGR